MFNKKNLNKKDIEIILNDMGVKYLKVGFDKKVKIRDANGIVHRIHFQKLYEMSLKQLETKQETQKRLEEEQKLLEEERVAKEVEAEIKRVYEEIETAKPKKPRKPRRKSVKSK